MRLNLPRASIRLLALAMPLFVAACGSGKTRPDAVPAGDIPYSFDVTVEALKDGQFEYNEAPLTSQDLRSALNYRKEIGQPMSTLLLRRSEKQSVKDGHIVAIAGMSVALGFRAWVEERGEINEIRTTTKGE
ncbi:hypothetical protein [Dokdonella sp.]|uniref:hypothetical protein n=1 Tax=Dokdonella sp. TaxID=2291710 RepID=UPI0025C6227D|nr:hypothetical protein [Dokdonella sp.]MBX3693470.1 hypothetical protein [Dokdonella sp.]